MNDKRNIIALNKLAIELDQLGEYRLSEDIDNLIRTAILWNGPKLRFDHPGVKDLRDNNLEKLPPQNALESAYQWLTSQPGKTLPRIKLPFIPSVNWTPEKFFADIFRDYKSTERISEDLINLLLVSPVFADLFYNYLYVQNEGNSRLLEAAKKMLAEAEPLLIEKLEKEFRKSNIYVSKRALDPNLGKITSSLLRMSEILPREFLSQVQATKEWIEHQTQVESEMLDARYNTYEGTPYTSRIKAHDELEDYLKPTEEKVEQLMRNSHILNRLNRIANTLDNSGYYKEASTLTKVMRRLAQEDPIFDPRQKTAPLDTYQIKGDLKIDYPEYNQNTRADEPKSKIDEELKRRTLEIIQSDEYKDWEVKRAIGSLINYVAEPDSRQEYHNDMEDMYPLGRPIPKSQSLMLKLMEMTDSYIKENDLSYRQIKDLYFTFMDIE
jgi:hypothetical protein